jgi:hypothetical protein
MATPLYVSPNWSEGYSETREFLTDIFVSRSGKEQRRARRAKPRCTINFSALLDAPLFRKMETSINLAAGQDLKIGSFVTPSPQLLISAEPGSSTLIVDTLPAAADFCIASGINVEYLKYVSQSNITNVASTIATSGKQLVLESPIQTRLREGARLRPVVEGKVGVETAISMASAGVGSASLKFELEPGTTIPAAGSLPTFPSLNGVSAFLVKPNWASPPTVNFVTPYEVVDYSTGIIASYAPVRFSSRTASFNFTESSYDDAMLAVQLFETVRGMAGEFYMPTWTSDLEIASNAALNATSIFVKRSEVAQLYATDKTRRGIAIYKKDGSIVTLRLTAIDSVAPAGQSRLTLASPLSAALSLADVSMVSWLPLCRFASDSLTLNWVTDTAANFVMNVQTLESL